MVNHMIAIQGTVKYSLPIKVLVILKLSKSIKVFNGIEKHLKGKTKYNLSSS